MIHEKKEKNSAPSDSPEAPGEDIDAYWMQRALEYARKAAEKGEVPVGALIIDNNGFVAAGFNSPIHLVDPTAHAEILAIRDAARVIGNYRLIDATLYVTLEPCIMCMGAIIHARIKRLVYGAIDPKSGAASSVYTIGRDGLLNHTLQLRGGVLASECGSVLKEFFRSKRKSEKTRTQND